MKNKSKRAVEDDMMEDTKLSNKQSIDHREFIVDQMEKFRLMGLHDFQDGSTAGLNSCPDGLSVEDWAYVVAMGFVASCATHIDKTLKKENFTIIGSDTVVLIDALGHDGDIIGASAFRLIDFLIYKLPANDFPSKYVVHSVGGTDPRQMFIPYLFRDDKSISEHCEYLSEEISHKCKLNEGDNSPVLAEFLLRLIGSNSDSLELSLSVLQAILQGRSVKQRLTESIQMHESYKRLGCFDEKGLEGYILLLNLILDEVTRLDIE